ncbi:MAG TPA: peptide-methionine (S)-S-oxide reductase MsrA [Burkholderiaceae bacterium]|nr:peptide-methionine (S)-S-oxide reductase MsrA [Burkholderiaceae bacterium]
MRRRPFLHRIGGFAVAALPTLSCCAEQAAAVPPPTLDEPPPTPPQARTIVLSGGCFWGVQAVYQHVKGVESAVSGYAGGSAADAHYETVSAGGTGHAESVSVTYDPAIVSLGAILQVFFSVAHDPTTRNRQGPDIGTQYRSAIFVTDAMQERVARSYVAQLDGAGVFPRRIVTEIRTLDRFYPAETYHQDYATLHPDSPYIALNDRPKVENLARLFPQRYREAPRLVGASPAVRG